METRVIVRDASLAVHHFSVALLIERHTTPLQPLADHGPNQRSVFTDASAENDRASRSSHRCKISAYVFANAVAEHFESQADPFAGRDALCQDARIG